MCLQVVVLDLGKNSKVGTKDSLVTLPNVDLRCNDQRAQIGSKIYSLHISPALVGRYPAQKRGCSKPVAKKYNSHVIVSKSALFAAAAALLIS